MSEFIEITHHDEVVEVALNRPEAFNALNIEMLTSLAQHLTQLATDRSARGIVIVGNGKAFCGGGDLKYVAQASEKYGPSFYMLATQFHLAILEIRRMKKPVVAAINGVAAGGGFSLALACDLRIMEKSAILKQAYTSSGLCVDGGGTFTLPRIVGLARALEIIAFDNPISSGLASEWGMVNQVVEDGKSLEAAIHMLKQLSKGSIHSFGLSKKLLTDSFNNTLESQLEMERKGLSDCGNHPDGIEGVTAFMEKRKPVFE